MTGLVEPSWLVARLEFSSCRIFDTRFSLQNPDEGKELYKKNHIPGAIYADLEKDLSGEIIPGMTGRHPLPSAQDFIARLQTWGISEDTQIVIYDEGSHAMAARMWWMLAVWLGHKHVNILHAGLKAWHQSQLPLTELISEYPETNYCPIVYQQMIVSVQDVESSLGENTLCLLDARGEARFRGKEEPLDSVAGHIPGAECVPFPDNMDSDGRFLSKVELQERFARWQCKELDTVCYCGSGVTACHNIFAMYLAGMTLPRLYAGSWSEWILDAEHPVVSG